MDDHEFQSRAEEALSDLSRRLTAASDRHGFDPDFNAGALTVEFDQPPAKFVVSPNSPVKQLWVSAHSQSFKLDWDASRAAFILRDSGQTLAELLAASISRHIGETVVL